MKTVNHIKELTEADEGLWMKLGGMGVLDGLSYKPLRNRLYKIIEVNEEEIVVKLYRSRTEQILPYYNWNQQARLYNKKDFNELNYR